jgi:hypothetical protein
MSNRVLSLALAASLVLIGAGSAGAQNINLANGQASLTLSGADSGAYAGTWMDRGALNNSDGRRDLVIGAPGGPGLSGHVYIMNGGPEPTGAQSLAIPPVNTIITGATTGDLFGYSGAIGNILNADGSEKKNLVVGAPLGSSGKGVAYLFNANFSGNSSITTSSAFLRIIGNTGDQLGSAFATADLDHDTFREIIIAARGTQKIYVIRGSAAQAGGTIDLSANPNAAYWFFVPGAGEVLAAGDVTGDGFSDVIVGSPSTNQVHFYNGIASGPSSPLLPQFPTVSFNFAVNADDRFGASVQIANIDSGNDNIRDIIIGAPNFDAPGPRINSGAVFVVWGSTALASHNPFFFDVVFYGAAPGETLGSYVTAGNANRDADDDLLMLASGANFGAGELTLYYARSKTSFGIDLGDGRRGVDLGVAANVDRKVIGLGNPGLGILQKAQIYEHTGEGAGDVIVSAPSANSNAGVIFFTVSPKFVLTPPSGVTVWTNEFKVIPATIVISNPSVVNVTWTATSNQPWLTVSPVSGNVDITSPGPLTLNLSSNGLAVGTYTGAVTLRSTSKHLDMTLTIPVTLIRAAITPPTTVTVMPGAGGLQLRWLAVPGAASYTVWRLDINGVYTPIASGITTNSYVDPNGIPPSGFRYTVTAVNNTGESVGSTLITVPFGVAGSRTPLAMTPQDYDEDGKADPTVYRSSTGQWLSQLSGGGTINFSWGAPAYQDQPVPADYDGDGKADMAVYRASTGDWIIARSGGGITTVNWGAPQYGDVPVPADYDGDGKADIGVYRVATGQWIIFRSTAGALSILWGSAPHADVPVPADYDGDGKADIAIYRATTGQWIISRSGNGQMINTQWGDPNQGDVPMPADYDEDGKADFAVYRSTTGAWYIAKSAGGFTTQLWGDPKLSDVPVAADFDGDGKADIAVYRFTTGWWYILRSSNGTLMQVNWGGPSAGDTVRFF